MQSNIEAQRIAFILERDGPENGREWIKRTMGIYRTAVLDKSHHASKREYRRGFIQSYCEFKQFLKGEMK